MKLPYLLFLLVLGAEAVPSSVRTLKKEEKEEEKAEKKAAKVAAKIDYDDESFIEFFTLDDADDQNANIVLAAVMTPNVTVETFGALNKTVEDEIDYVELYKELTGKDEVPEELETANQKRKQAKEKNDKDPGTRRLARWARRLDLWADFGFMYADNFRRYFCHYDASPVCKLFRQEYYTTKWNKSDNFQVYTYVHGSGGAYLELSYKRCHFSMGPWWWPPAGGWNCDGPEIYIVPPHFVPHHWVGYFMESSCPGDCPRVKYYMTGVRPVGGYVHYAGWGRVY